MKTACLVIGLLLSIASCKHCECCGETMGGITCVMGTDTIRRYKDPGKHEVVIEDSLTYYRNKGYNCTYNFNPYLMLVKQTCGKKAIKELEESSKSSCVPNAGTASGACYR